MKQTPSGILFIHEVASRLGLSISSVNRYLAKARRGEMVFILPISEKGCKCRWLASDVESYLLSLSTARAPPPVSAPTVGSLVDESQLEKQRRVELARLDELALHKLAIHALGRKSMNVVPKSLTTPPSPTSCSVTQMDVSGSGGG